MQIVRGAQGRRPTSIRTTAASTFSAVVAVMPAFLVGASGVFLRDELQFDEAGLGIAVAVFFGVSALSSVGGGHLSELIGAENALVLVCIGSAIVMLGIAVLAGHFTHLLLFLALGGALQGVAQPATNLALARGVVVRPAFMFGVKQASAPLATMVAGASVPLISLTIGWRWAFGAAAALAGGVAIFVPRERAHHAAKTTNRRRKTTNRRREGDAPMAPLVALAVAAGIGTGSAMALSSFLVETAVAGGSAVRAAGWLLVVGSVAGVLARVCVGWVADWERVQALYVVSAMLGVGAGGYGMVALGGPVLLTIGALLAYAGGWGWGGLLSFAIVQLNPNAPAAASGIVLTGAAGGAALGPFAFGYVVTSATFQAAWVLAAVAAFSSAGLVLATGSWLSHHRDRREAAS